MNGVVRGAESDRYGSNRRDVGTVAVFERFDEKAGAQKEREAQRSTKRLF